jgi:6-phosphogluconolactonase
MLGFRNDALLWFFLLLSPTLWAQDSYLYIGSYTTLVDGTPTGSEGIYIYKFHSETGKLDSIGSVEVASPSYLNASPHNLFLYSVSDSRTKGAGSVSAFDINKKTGELNFINKQPTGGDNPIYVEVAPNNSQLFVANYNTGSFAMFKLGYNGEIGDRLAFEELKGSSVNPERQTQSHPHMAAVVPGTPFILVTDLGTDKVMLYIMLSLSGLKPSNIMDTTGLAIVPGNGPRHVAFHPNGKYIYLTEEMSGTVAVISFNFGKMGLIERVATHPADATGPFATADVHLSPDGKFLYVTNRGEENNIAIYKVNPKSGKLTLVGYQSTLGKTPRNFTIDPTGNFLLVANQSTGNVVVFKRDKKTGLLTPTGETIKVPQPTCLKMIWK